MMEWNSQDGIAKLLIAFEKELHQCVSQDLQHRFQIFEKLGVKFNDLFL